MVKNDIIVFGAGRSSYFLITELERIASEHNLHLKVADIKVKPDIDIPTSAEYVCLDIQDEEGLKNAITNARVVVSMLPARLHAHVIRFCVEYGIHVATASYLSAEINAFHKEAENKDVLILNELGLDPGLDHLSAMKMIHDVQNSGARITHFESFTGGLVAPESDNNPWGYKFTWNPRNVVVAGQGGAVKFVEEGKYKFIPYHKLFRRTEIIQIPEYGKFEGYANRDSLKYRETYGLSDVQTMFRGTLRRPGFCKAWDCLIQLGLTDDSYELPKVDAMTHRDFVNTFLAYNPDDSVELKLKQYLKIDQDDVDLWERLEFLDLFSNEKVGLKNGSPAQVLQHILQKKWKLSDNDRDMIVMWHKLVYTEGNDSKELNASLVVTGESQQATAMAKTVGLPLAFGVELILKGEIKARGCQLPIIPDIYLPILKKLESRGIGFEETLI